MSLSFIGLGVSYPTHFVLIYLPNAISVPLNIFYKHKAHILLVNYGEL